VNRPAHPLLHCLIFLSCGEERYILEVAKSLRLEILQSLQKIETIGKEISSLDASSQPKVVASQARINRTVGQFARRFVQNNLPPLRVLPTEEEHRRLSERRTTNLAVACQRDPAKEPSPATGWMPSSSSLFSADAPIPEREGESDPRAVLLRQIDIVANYLAQAKVANRSDDEIHDLAENLADLESELARISTLPAK
uniref:C2H2-type domain-containing protein n=1 Tax=Mesocestoides corti TaxID=53468 RepID=A0A5K3FDE1_MESCO